MQGYDLDKMDVFFSLEVHHYNDPLLSNLLFSFCREISFLFVGKGNLQP